MRKQCAGQRDSVRDSMRKQSQSITQSVGQRDTEETKRNETKRTRWSGCAEPPGD